ncbi:hypothetical protein CLAIMM_06436 isoform 2 [Cladophialophora immunda]|nr:hypothetical protein CLAIMM_06436 isoform 1 [Cladophialophora immunda]OQV01018.1 hypothetical protein CLAIMM_06436 isoform 2 [Cladophialophora immunda]
MEVSFYAAPINHEALGTCNTSFDSIQSLAVSSDPQSTHGTDAARLHWEAAALTDHIPAHFGVPGSKERPMRRCPFPALPNAILLGFLFGLCQPLKAREMRPSPRWDRRPREDHECLATVSVCKVRLVAGERIYSAQHVRRKLPFLDVPA